MGNRLWLALVVFVAPGVFWAVAFVIMHAQHPEATRYIALVCVLMYGVSMILLAMLLGGAFMSRSRPPSA